MFHNRKPYSKCERKLSHDSIGGLVAKELIAASFRRKLRDISHTKGNLTNNAYIHDDKAPSILHLLSNSGKTIRF